MKTFYECGYGGNASIQTKSDGHSRFADVCRWQDRAPHLQKRDQRKTVAFALDGWALQRGEEPCRKPALKPLVITMVTDREGGKLDATQAAFFQSLATALRCRHKNEASARLVPARLHVKNADRNLTKKS